MANSHTDQPIFAQFEVIRRGHDDLAEPELAHVAVAIERDPVLSERLSRIQHADEQFALAFHDVPVPADAEKRLLGRLAAADGSTSEETYSDESDSTVTRRSGSYRWLWASAAAIAASIAVAVFLFPQTTPEVPISHGKLLNDAVAFFKSETSRQSKLVSEELPPADYAASNDVRYIATAHWRKLDDFLGTPAVAYDLVAPRGEQATLYVAHRRLANAERFSMPTPEALLSTGGMSATCWQSDDLLYVLVVAGDREQYEAFVRQPGSAFAVAMPAETWISDVSAWFAQAS